MHREEPVLERTSVELLPLAVNVNAIRIVEASSAATLLTPWTGATSDRYSWIALEDSTSAGIPWPLHIT